ncbi:MAG: GNAT family N-acetyltransferase [Patescibacteria group bacterium]
MSEVTYTTVTDINAIDSVSELKADYGDLHFSFSEEYLKRLKESLGDKNALHIIAHDKDKSMGYIASSEKLFPGYSFIKELIVDPIYQGRGIGKKLVGLVIESAKDNNLKGVVVQTEFTNTPARELYEKLGFIPVENKEWKEGMTYRMDFLFS